MCPRFHRNSDRRTRSLACVTSTSRICWFYPPARPVAAAATATAPVRVTGWHTSWKLSIPTLNLIDEPLVRSPTDAINHLSLPVVRHNFTNAAHSSKWRPLGSCSGGRSIGAGVHSDSSCKIHSERPAPSLRLDRFQWPAECAKARQPNEPETLVFFITLERGRLCFAAAAGSAPARGL